MNKQEFSSLAAAMKAYYPQDWFIPDKISMTAWYTALCDLDYDTAKKAVQIHVQTSPFAPSVADIRKRAAEIICPVQSDWSDGWGQVRKAISKYGMWDFDGAMASFDPYTAEAVKRIGWESICTTENIETTRAQFRQVYELVSKREKEQMCLSENLRQIGELKMLKGAEQ